MALREFADSLGRTWQAWDTYPGGTGAPLQKDSLFSKYMADVPTRAGKQLGEVRTQYEAGWLTFKGAGERRRLAPIPHDWEVADEATMRTYLDAASKL